MKVKIKKYEYGKSICSGSAWYARDYLAGRTCEVLAVQAANGNYVASYFVLHPITKKSGYWIGKTDCEIVEKGKVPTFKQFLKNNKYG